MNPYKVLGVSETATPEEIRAAYLSLVKKYHPDKYTDNPLKELAGEKLKEINQAYEMLTKSRARVPQEATAGVPAADTADLPRGSTAHTAAPTRRHMCAREALSIKTISAVRALCSTVSKRTTPNGIISTASSICGRDGTKRPKNALQRHTILNRTTRSIEMHINPCKTRAIRTAGAQRSIRRTTPAATAVPRCCCATAVRVRSAAFNLFPLFE